MRWVTWRLYLFSKSNSVIIPGRLAGDNEELYAMEPRLRLEWYPRRARRELGTPRSMGQRFSYWATADPRHL